MEFITVPRSAALVMLRITRVSLSKPTTAIWSCAPNISAAALAEARASAIGWPSIEPLLSMTNTIAKLGFCFSFS